jgi:hypothetical protein
MSKGIACFFFPMPHIFGMPEDDCVPARTAKELQSAFDSRKKVSSGNAGKLRKGAGGSLGSEGGIS